jgi:hypothetical protein
MMRIEHLAADGSVVAIEADADLTTQVTATGWAIVPSLMRAHPFTIYPAGHSTKIEETVRSNFPNISIRAIEDYSLKAGNLRVSEVSLPTATGDSRDLTVGAWEGETGCITTSLVGFKRQALVEVFDTLQFSERARGLAIDSPVTPRPREPEIIKEIPELGVLSMSPAIPSTLERIPKARGYVANHGEVFRIREPSQALIFVSPSAVVRIDPLERANAQEMLAVARDLRVEWSPEGSRR